MSLYEILCVHPDSNQKMIKSAYRNLCKIHHPDKGGNKEKFQQIQEAYRVLSNAISRNEYDRTGKIPEASRVESEASQAIVQLFRHKIDQLARDSSWSPTSQLKVIDTILSEVNMKMTQVNREIVNVDKTVIRLNSQAGKVTSKGEDNLYSAALNSMIEECHNSLATLKHDLAVMEKVIELLSSYEDVEEMSAALNYGAS